MTAKYGVIIGRFQTDELTAGHRALIDTVLARHGYEKVLIVIGDRKSPPTSQNPLPYIARVDLISKYYPVGAHLARQWDARTDEEWSMTLDKTIRKVFGLDVPKEDVVLYSGRDGFAKHYHGEFPVELIDTGIMSTATDRRARITKYPNFRNQDFLQGMIYQMSQIGFRNYETVDIAVVKHGETGSYVLLGRKPNEKQWRFPGGFVEKGETFAEAARRELKEETTLYAEHPFTYLGDFIINDWRLRDAKNEAHRTVLMYTPYAFGAIKASDDLAEVKWHWLNFPYEQQMVAEHQPLFQALRYHVLNVVIPSQKK